MSSAEIILGLLAIGLSLFFTTAVLSLRGFSHGRLEALLTIRGQQDRMEKLIEKSGPLTLSCATLRALSMMGLLLVTLHMAIPAEGPVRGIHYLEGSVASAVLIVLFGVGIPNAWAAHGGERFLVATLPVLHVLSFMTWPATAVLQAIDSIVRRLAGIREIDEELRAEQLERDILSRISAGEKQGLVDEQEADMLESVMEFRDKQVHEIMTPRTEVIGIPKTAMIDEVREVLRKEGHSRYPIYDDSIDMTSGVLYVKDLLTADHAEETQAGDLARKVPMVPASKPLHELLRDFQENKVHIAIVLDEYGGMAGLVTIEDILEELVGEIVDEYEPTEPIPIQQIDSCTAEIDARVHIDELNEALDIELPENEDYDTIGGFVFTRLGKIPEQGEELVHENVRIRVLDAEERKVNRVRIQVDRVSEKAS